VKQPGEPLFHYFHHYGKVLYFRLGDEKVKVLGHHDVTEDDKSIFLPGAFQHAEEQITALVAAKLRAALITTTGDEMQIVPAVPALQISGHIRRVLR